MAEDKKTNDREDAMLVEKALSSSGEFGRIIEKYQKPLGRYVRRMASPSADEMDMILQDIFIKIYENLNDFDRSLSFSSWIYRIAHNESVDFHRKRKRYGGSLDDPASDEDGLTLAETIAAEADTALETDVYYREKWVAEVLNNLDPKYKSVLILKFLEGRDYDEISDILKKPPGTIATLIHRAKAEFRRFLKARGIEKSDL